jgi:hypothetical protein
MSGTQRIMKAWSCKVEWSDDADIVYAPTAAKARYTLKLRLGDCYPDLQFQEISARRAADRDIALPAQHRLVADLSEAERDIILHAYGHQGGRPERAGYRDHYCCAPGDSRMHRLAWELGLFRGPFGEEDMSRSMWGGVFYYLSDLGKHVARSMLPLYGGEA